jgi:hypothetical protein
VGCIGVAVLQVSENCRCDCVLLLKYGACGS